MKILVACDESQRVTTEFRKLGHEAYSCDTEFCSGGHPEWHIWADVLPLLDGKCMFLTCDWKIHHIYRWDMIVLMDNNIKKISEVKKKWKETILEKLM